MVTLISKDTAEHFLWRDICDGWYLMQQPDRLTVLHERMPPGTSEARHFHRHTLQFFFILSGIATFELDGQFFDLRPHEGVAVAPLLPHQMRNESTAPLEFLVISQPNSRDDRVYIDPLEG
jgi:mannose-6-phosphate isomerase-like protein (cupin superfamily)